MDATNKNKIYEDLVKKLPTRAPIFLPTEKVPLDERIAGVKRVKEIYDTTLDAVYRPKIRALKDKHKNRRRCFIIGNGPSLNKTDLSQLENEITFAVNGFFLKAAELGWTPTYYVVEDHLVAEDRMKWIEDFKGPTKLFPTYLAYCKQAADDTIFFNHRPRVSYPDSFDFSTDAEKITYAGCTVTFTCMQLAHYMGFDEIYLVGVDASYDLPKDVEESTDYGVGVLDMKSDDPNHFHPDYFGKGFRWHDPQVGKMVEAYGEARKVTDQTKSRIYNATVGGQLEVFDRVPFDKLFPLAKSPEEMLAQFEGEDDEAVLAEHRVLGMSGVKSDYPRVMVFDITLSGNGTATGEVKKNLLSGWPAANIQQFYSTGREKFGISSATQNRKFVSVDDAVKLTKMFNPDVILYRPVMDNMALHEAAMKTIKELGIPFVTWIMDDWPERFSKEDPARLAKISGDLSWLFDNANHRLSIGQAMSDAFSVRYNVPFTAMANGILESEWVGAQTATNDGGGVRIRYAGSLAANMTLDSLKRVASAIEGLPESLNATFEIKTSQLWYDKAHKEFEGFKSTRIFAKHFSAPEYREWLMGADISVIAYNYDEETAKYVQYSVANKMPECLISGSALLACGPRNLATIAYVADKDCALVVDSPAEGNIRAAIETLASSKELRDSLSAKARTVALEKHNLLYLRPQLASILKSASNGEMQNDYDTNLGLRRKVALARKIARDNNEPMRLDSLYYQRDAHARFDETDLIYHLFKHDKPRVMVDVGAHYGGSALPFSKKDWQIYCYEPDPKNRQHLKKRFLNVSNVNIDPRAVGAEPDDAMPFYSSEESTGISGMLKFRDSHEQVATVEVTTVENIIRDHKIQHIDFLKIDVEGYDFGVLKGVPWDRFKPDIIECEFEDAKTNHLGHTWRDICDYLVERGYTVYVSEWHPIIRYGIAHDWYALKKYPCNLADVDGWGNLLAFQKDLGESVIAEALERIIKVKNEGLVAVPNASERAARSLKTTSGNLKPVKSFARVPGRPFYADFADNLKSKSPAIFRLGQFLIWSLRFAKRHFVIVSMAIALFVFLIYGVPRIDSLKASTGVLRWFAWALPILGAIGFLAAYMNAMIAKITQDAEDGKETFRLEILAAVRDQNSKEISNIKLISNDLGQKYTGLQADITAHEKSIALKMAVETAKINGIHGKITNNDKALNDRFSAHEKTIATKMAADASTQSSKLNSLSSEVVTKLTGFQSEIAGSDRAWNDRFTAHENKLAANITAKSSEQESAWNEKFSAYEDSMAAKNSEQVSTFNNKFSAYEENMVAKSSEQESSWNDKFSAYEDSMAAKASEQASKLNSLSNDIVEKFGNMREDIAEHNKDWDDKFEKSTDDFADLVEIESLERQVFEERFIQREKNNVTNQTLQQDYWAQLLDDLRVTINNEKVESSKMAKEISHIAKLSSKRLQDSVQKQNARMAELSSKLTSVKKNVDKQTNSADAKELSDLQTSFEQLKSDVSDNVFGSELKGLQTLVTDLQKQLEDELGRNSTSFMVSQEQLEARMVSKIKTSEGKVSSALSTKFDKQSSALQAKVNVLNKNIETEIRKAGQGIIESQEVLRNRIRKAEENVFTTSKSNKSNREMIKELSLNGGKANKKIISAQSASQKKYETLQRKLETVVKNIQDLNKRSKNASKATKSELAQVTADFAGIRDQITVVASEQVPAEQTFEFQTFNRTFSKKHIKTIQNDWLKTLNLRETPRSLAYMASRVVTLENNLRGRLATTVEDAVLRSLVSLAVPGKNLKVLEIGTLFGIGIAIIHDRVRSNFSKVGLTVIDPLEGYYGNDVPDIVTGEKVTRANLVENLGTANIPDSDITIIEGFSTDEDVIDLASKSAYDVLIIDGDHSYAGVKADFVTYAPFVKRGGFIVIDDYDTDHWPEITKYVDDELMPRDDLTLIGASWRTVVFKVIKKLKS